MLQGKISKLDNDFITIWSNYMLYREIDKEALRALAEMGQINAVQSYYLFFDERNTKVDEIIEGYKGINPDENLAKAHKLAFDNPEDVAKAQEYALEVGDLTDELRDIDIEYGDTLFTEHTKLRQLASKSERAAKERNDLQNRYYNLPHVKLRKETVSEYWTVGIQTKNPLFNERAVEVQRSNPLADIADLRKSVKITRKGLVKRYKQDKEDIAVHFALGKNLIMFRASDKEKVLATKLLKTLGERELSDEVKAYKDSLTKDAGEKE